MKFKIILIAGISLISSVFQISIAAENLVAKIVIMRGLAKAKLLNGSTIDLKVDQDISEGAIIQTSEKSFVKLLFIDKSQMNLGPSSQMIINAFPKKEAGIITLVKGQIRSQVTKDYMEIDDKTKSKLFIKTTTAAMGIRGTDFQVNYNPENRNTSLITFEGAVAMSNFDRNSKNDNFDQSRLEKVVSNEKSVMVTAGHISAINANFSDRAMVPTKLAPNQIEALKDNENGMKENSNSEGQKKFRNPIPPGTDGTAFSGNQNENNIIKQNSKIDPNGFFNEKTGEYKLPAGSIIDLKTVNLIPPPANAAFDNNTKTYIVPDSFGRIDKQSGDYRAPEGLKLNSDGVFLKDDKNTKPNKDERNPASVNNQGPLPVNIPPPLNEMRPDMQVFTQKFAPTVLDRPVFMNEQDKLAAQDRLLTTEKVNQTNSNLGNTTNSTKVKIIFNAQ